MFALGSVGSKFITFFLVPLYTNCLTPEELGIADLVFTVAQLAVPAITLVIFDAVIRFGLERGEHPESILLAGVLVWGAGSALGLLLLPLTGLYAAISPYKWYLYAYLVLEGLLDIELNYLKVKRKNLSYAAVSILQTLTLASLNIALLLVLDIGIKGYLLSSVISLGLAAALAAILGGAVGDLRRARFEKPLFAKMIKFSAPLIFNNLAWWIIQSSNKMLIEYFLGASILGLFTVASRLPSLIQVAVSVFQQAWGVSSVREMDGENDTKFYSDVFGAYSFLMFAASLALNAVIKPFMRIYVGEEFFEAWRYVPPLVVAAAFSAISGYFGSMYAALKRSVNNMISTVSAACLNLVLNLLLIRTFGLWGAVAGTAAAYIFLSFFRLFDVKRFVNLKINLPRLLIGSAAVTAHGAAVCLGLCPTAATAAAALVLLAVNYRVMARIFIKK